MDFLDISSEGATYRYAVKIDQKFKQNNKRDFKSTNPSQQKHGKGGPNSEKKGRSKDGYPHDKHFKPQTKNGNKKLKKDNGE